MSELKTCVTCQDLIEINALLDMQSDINYWANQDAARKKHR